MELSFFDLVTRWWAGEGISAHYLWGVKILWLGRAGKLLVYVSGAMLVVEVIGVDRIRKWLNELIGARVPDSTWGHARDFVGAVVCVLSGIGAPHIFVPEALWYLRDLSKHGEWWQRIAADGATLLGYIVSVIVSFILFQLMIHLGVKSINNPELTTRIKITSFALLTVGVFLDLLAS